VVVGIGAKITVRAGAQARLGGRHPVAHGEPAVGLRRHKGSSAPVGAASGIFRQEPCARAVAGLVRTETRCRPSRGSALLLQCSFPRLARRGPNDNARYAGFRVRLTVVLTPMGWWVQEQARRSTTPWPPPWPKRGIAFTRGFRHPVRLE